MKLTQKQMEVVEKYKSLENEYGKGNVFLRWVNDYWKVCFVIHKVGDSFYTPLYDYRINRRITDAFESKGLLACYDNHHNENVNPNDWEDKPEGWGIIGSRIRTELLSK